MSVFFLDGRVATAALGRDAFATTSAIAASTHLPQSTLLYLTTTRGDDVLVDLPLPEDLAPLRGRPSVYLDQNHWSTLANAMHRPERVKNGDELAAATRLTELARSRAVVLPMSAAHILETCKQADPDERYARALTLVQLSAGWQLRHPLEIRRFELLRALTSRYHEAEASQPAGVTLEPDAIHNDSAVSVDDVGADLPDEARWAVHAMRCIGAVVDVMLDADHVPPAPISGWPGQFEEFARFLAENPTGRELKRRRTHAKFIGDLLLELVESARQAAIAPAQMNDWALHHSEGDLRGMPALGLYREVLHEKLCNATLRWEENDLVDMMYLTSAAGYCDYVVGERTHISYVARALRRLGRSASVHRTLRDLVDQL